MEILDIVVVVSLALLGFSLALLLVFLIPVLLQLQKVLQSTDEILRVVQREVLPNVSEFSKILEAPSRFADHSRRWKAKLSNSLMILREGIRTGINSYHSKNK